MLALAIREPGIELRNKWVFAQVTLVTGLFSFYLQFHLSKRYIYNNFSRTWFFSSILSFISTAFLYFFILEQNFKHRGNYSIEYPVYYALPVVLFFSISGIMFQGFHYTFIQKRKEQELKAEKQNLELNLIRSQLNPHFLFNVLNNVDSYIRKDPQKASNSIIKLSSLLRYLLYETSHGLVPIESEIKFIEDYIDLQRQRLQHPELCIFQKEIADNSIMIAPALFLPYIENAFVHCPVNDKGAILNFAMCSERDKIVFTALNTKINLPASTNNKKGIGLDLAKKRLDVLYPNRYNLHVIPAGTLFIVELTIHHNEA